MDLIIGIMIGTLFGGMLGCVVTHDEFVDRLIEAELGEFGVDSTTGDTTFIIYAEELTTTDK